jgi:hypothetical protein
MKLMDRLFVFILSGFTFFVHTESHADAGVRCAEDAGKLLNKARDAQSSADSQSGAVAVSATQTQLNSAGAASTATGSQLSTSAAAAASTCASYANQAIELASTCHTRSTTEPTRSQVRAQSQKIINAAEDQVTLCNQKALGNAGTASSQNDATNALLMMTAMQGLSGGMGGGGGNKNFNYPDFNYTNFNDPNKKPPTIKDRDAPVVTSVANDRTPGTNDIDDADNTTNELDIGSPDVIALEQNTDEENSKNSQYGGGAMASLPTSGSEFSDSNNFEMGSVGVRGLASQPAASALEADKGLGEAGLAGFDGFNFGDDKPAKVDADQEANDAAFLGKTKKEQQSLAAQIAQRKKEQEEAQARKRELAMANAQRIAAEFKVTAKSCAERKWKGKECQALRADPLLNID